MHSGHVICQLECCTNVLISFPGVWQVCLHPWLVLTGREPVCTELASFWIKFGTGEFAEDAGIQLFSQWTRTFVCKWCPLVPSVHYSELAY